MSYGNVKTERRRHNSAENMVFIRLLSQNGKRSLERILRMSSADTEKFTNMMQ